ncbi:MAG: cytidine deaminase [Bacteroidota bacterium]|nr:cytidine deaminase [Bacteroidota bacterium]MDX5430460.1 cytidine deaminase [Bacteroidota bacterium]MDX5469221.1 cytidine deaminase [Bacteroidota bacterium]
MGRIIKQVSEIEVLSWEELEPGQKQLIEAARKSAKVAYAPYSDFLVGAALELENRLILTGNNQENMAYPSGLCAERVVLFFAGANYPDTAPVRLAITAHFRDHRQLKEPATPCGACLQALKEYESRFGANLEILLDGPNEVWKVNGLQHLLPFAFSGLRG